MQWTLEHHKHLNTERLQKAEQNRMAQELEKNQTPPRKGILGRRRETRHNL